MSANGKQPRKCGELSKSIEHERYLGTLGLLADCLVYVTDDIRDMIIRAFADACEADPNLRSNGRTFWDDRPLERGTVITWNSTGIPAKDGERVLAIVGKHLVRIYLTYPMVERYPPFHVPRTGKDHPVFGCGFWALADLALRRGSWGNCCDRHESY